jgi:DNA polymerase I-like protein with 3'-5' exonuclease and polymerase domains
MAGLIFDIESNGFLADLTKIHCIAYRDEAGGEVKSVGGKTDEKIRNFLTHLEDAPVLIGHNIIEFDVPALKKVYPSFNPKGELWDTLLDCQTIWTDLRDKDFAFQRKNPDFPTKHIGRHSLKAWGVRLGVYKIDILKQLDAEEDSAAAFAEWTQELEDYCKQDVVVGAKLYELIKVHERFSKQAHDMEMEFKQYMLAQEQEGFPFDEKAAQELYAELAAERARLESELQAAFPPWEVSKDFIPKRDNKTKGYVAGVPFKKSKVVQFNPRSHDHIASRLAAVRGWKPESFTESGKPETDGDVIAALGNTWPECKVLARHIEIQKIIGMVAEGRSAYLKKLSPDGRLRGRVGTCGTVTGRCSHKEPNLGNIPRRSDLGKRVRKLFIAPTGFKLVGCDAKGLELRMLAHFLARFDGGNYVKVVVEGDPHSYHQQLAGLPTRDNAKTFIYGFIYGAGDEKIGLIVGKGAAVGRKLRFTFLKKFPALDQLKNAVAAKAKMYGTIKGLDGRALYVRAIYSSLNTLLQSAGALVMKMAVVIFNREIRKRGWFQSGAVRQVAFVHDEIQSLVREDLVTEVEQLAVECIRKAGEYFGLRCPTDGDAKHGSTWGDTH